MLNANIYRTHSCGELRKNNIGESVRLAGWINSIRRLGGLTFVTLRDHYGVTQLVVNDENVLNGVNKETVISVFGKVIERESKNPNMPTGDIEIDISELKVLGKAQNVLPFEISEAPNTKEELRLKYRFLDLRNSEAHNNIVLRSELLHEVRNMFYELNFTEIQTPILTSSSPEGARDFLVPSRLNPGKFYALPQSPQQFKQLLMISGFDKYFQVAPCFRDEDARADRTPGEFYQVDLEMSFATQEDVFAVLENVMPRLCSKFTNKQVSKAPFIRIAYNDSMEKYCTDKPDLRNPLTCKDLTSIFSKTEFNAFKNKTIKGLVANTEGKPRAFYDALTKYIIDIEGKGLAYFRMQEGTLNGSALKFLSEKEISELTKAFNPKNGETIFVIADEKNICTKLMGALRNKLGEELNLIDNNSLQFCWIVDFPFFEWDDENKAIAFSHNPFSMPQGGLDSLINKKPLDILAYQFDLVLNGYELASGAVRNHEPEIMVKAFEIAGYNKEVVESKFPALYNAFSYGAPPHAGLAFGFDRLLMILCDVAFIRDIIAFPFNKNAQDLLMGAPNTVFDKQLIETHIKIDNKK